MAVVRTCHLLIIPLSNSINKQIASNMRKVIKNNEMGGACSACGGMERCVCRVLMGKPEGRRPLGRPRRRWEDNIRMDLREVGWRVCGLDGAGSG
jgi:hypothetical protein